MTSPAPDNAGLPTLRAYVGVHQVHTVCAVCDHTVRLDLAALVAAGHSNTPLTNLPLRCTACGKRGH